MNHPIPMRRPIDLRAAGLVLLLCLIWGIQQVVMKSVAGDVPPSMQLAIRFAGAAFVFGLIVLKREGRQAFADGTLRSGLLLGAAFSLEFVFVGEALRLTSAAHATVFLYSAPIFSLLGLQFLPEERLGFPQWLGITAAFGGIVLAFLGPGGRPASALIAGDALALLGGMAWGVSSVVLRRGRVGAAAVSKTIFYQVAAASVALSAFALATGQAHVKPTMAAVAALLFQTAVISILSYLLWFWLLRHYLVSRLMLLSLLTPVFGVVFGVLLLGDSIDVRFGLGAALVLTGLAVVNAQAWRPPVEP